MENLSLEHKKKFLEIAGEITFLLTEAEYQEFATAMEKSLALLGEYVDANQIAIWKSYEQDGDILYSRLYGGNIVPENESENRFKIPIRINKEEWGFINIEKDGRETGLNEQETKDLQTAGLLFASSIIQNQGFKKLVMEREKAISGSEAKSRFLANMSHEIRTPLNAIMGMTVIALKAEDTEKKEDCLQKINSASKHLFRIINDVLDVSKIEAQKFELAPTAFDFEKMIQNVKVLVESKVLENHQKLLVKIGENVPSQIVTDEVRLTQIIINLLSNAFKFSKQNDTVVLEIKLLQETDNNVQLGIAVTDCGIGITKEQAHRLFREFEQADKEIAGAYGGTGLGLAISKNIVEMMNGHIGVESEAGKGSKFVFDIWADKAKQNKEDFYEDYRAVLGQYDLSSYTILMVEDIEVNREILFELLKNSGAVLESAENGYEAVEKFKKNPDQYDLILMDVLMPVMDGMQATRKIRAIEEGSDRKIPIIALTASAFTEDVEECLRAGMNDHIAKPIEYRDFIFKIAKNLNLIC